MLDAAGGVLNVAGEEGMVEMEKDRKLLEEDPLLLRHEDHSALKPLRVHLPHAPDTLGKMVYPSYVSPGPMQPALQCGYCDNSGNYITKFKENIRTRGNKITPVQRGRKAEIRPYRRFFAAGAA